MGADFWVPPVASLDLSSSIWPYSWLKLFSFLCIPGCVCSSHCCAPVSDPGSLSQALPLGSWREPGLSLKSSQALLALLCCSRLSRTREWKTLELCSGGRRSSSASPVWILRHRIPPGAVGRSEVFAVERAGWEQLLHHLHTPVATGATQNTTQREQI